MINLEVETSYKKRRKKVYSTDEWRELQNNIVNKDVKMGEK